MTAHTFGILSREPGMKRKMELALDPGPAFRAGEGPVNMQGLKPHYVPRERKWPHSWSEKPWEERVGPLSPDAATIGLI